MLLPDCTLALIKPWLRVAGASVILGGLAWAINSRPVAANFSAIINSGAQIGPPPANQVITVPTPIPVIPNGVPPSDGWPQAGSVYIPHAGNTVIRHRVNYSTIVNPYGSGTSIRISSPTPLPTGATNQHNRAQPIIIQRVRVIGPDDPHPVNVPPLGQASQFSIFDTPGNVIQLD